MSRITVLSAAALVWASAVHATSIADLDLSALVFDVQTEASLGQNIGEYTGVTGLTGDTVGFSVLAFDPLTDTVSTQPFAFPAPTGLGSPSFEHVHVALFTLTFDRAISWLLIYAQNDGFAAPTGIDLGIAPKDVGGATAATGPTGFSVSTSNVASYFLYEFAAPTTTVVNNFVGGTDDGFDLAFFAAPAPTVAVPVPSALALGLTGIGALTLLRRRA